MLEASRIVTICGAARMAGLWRVIVFLLLGCQWGIIIGSCGSATPCLMLSMKAIISIWNQGANVAGPWERYQQPGQPPAVIYGEPDPFKASAEIRAERSANRQDAAAIRAAEASDRAAAAAERAAATDARKVAAEERKLAAGGGIETTEGERTAAFLATRVANGLETLKGIGSGGDATLGTRIAENLPFGLGNYAISEDRQRAATAQLDVLDAALTLGTGAAYTKEQIEGYRQSYFPQPGDGEDVIADKQSRLKVLLEAARVKAGAAAPAIDRALGNAQASNTGVAIGARDNGFSLSPENEQKLLSFAPEASSPAEIVAFARGLGVNIPQEEAQRAFDYYRQGGRETAQISYGAANRALAGERDTTGGAIDAAVRGAADTLTLGFADEIAAAGDTVFGSGTMAENLARQRAIDATDEEVNPYARLGGQIAGGFGLPTGGATGARGLARIGALYGAGYGAGSADGSATDRLIGAAQGGVVGGATGGVLGALGSRLASRGGGGGSGGGGASDLMQAAQRQGVDVLPADVGGNLTQRLTSGTAQTTFGGPRIINAARSQQEQAANAVSRLAGEVSQPTTQYGAGRAAQSGLTKWIKTSENEANNLYSIISVPSDRPAEIRNTLAALEEVTQGMQSNPELSSIWTGHPRLRATLEAIRRPEVRQVTAPGGLPAWEKNVGGRWQRLTQREIDAGAADGGGASWEDMKRLRSIVGEIIGQPSLSSEGPEISALRRVYAGLSEDMRLTAERTSPAALREFERANSFFRARESRIKNVVEPIIGDGSGDGQAAFNRISNWSKNKGESVRVAQMVRSLPAEDREKIGATVISELGKSSAGRQNAEGTAFSLGEFLTHYNGLDGAAKQALFTRAQRSGLNDMAKIAERTKEAQRFANTSNTAGASNVNATTGGLAAVIPLAFTAGPLAAAAAASPALAQYITGRMLSSPRMVEWLTRTPKDPSVAIRRLEQIAIREPAIAPDATRLAQALQQSPTRAAASEQEQQ